MLLLKNSLFWFYWRWLHSVSKTGSSNFPPRNSLRYFLKMQIPGIAYRHTASKVWGWGSRNLYLNKPLLCSWCLLKFESHWILPAFVSLGTSLFVVNPQCQSLTSWEQKCANQGHIQCSSPHSLCHWLLMAHSWDGLCAHGFHVHPPFSVSCLSCYIIFGLTSFLVSSSSLCLSWAINVFSCIYLFRLH